MGANLCKPLFQQWFKSPSICEKLRGKKGAKEKFSAFLFSGVSTRGFGPLLSSGEAAKAAQQRSHNLLRSISETRNFSAQEGDMAPAPAPGMASSTNSALPVLGGILITSLMSFIALLSH
ncbi:hypothetical protein MRB53_015656 [Persea americana]|uniref:Uncharacterized protein n=1 Tax=Persea americana TaxID=3435 RepID=A0ACC2LZV6_PERAE|nr:hypothetical protein MRB53_015656 [Persea americana]